MNMGYSYTYNYGYATWIPTPLNCTYIDSTTITSGATTTSNTTYYISGTYMSDSGFIDTTAFNFLNNSFEAEVEGELSFEE